MEHSEHSVFIQVLNRGELTIFHNTHYHHGVLTKTQWFLCLKLRTLPVTSRILKNLKVQITFRINPNTFFGKTVSGWPAGTFQTIFVITYIPGKPGPVNRSRIGRKGAKANTC